MTTRASGSVVALVLLSALGCSSSPSSDDAGTNDAGTDVTDGLPTFGQACAPILVQGDPQCAPGLVCISVGAQQGRNLCTKTCTTEGAACAGAPDGTTPTCGREYQVDPALSRVCEFFCNATTTCPPGTSCLIDFDGKMTCQPPIQ